MTDEKCYLYDADQAAALIQEVMERSGQPLYSCFQCKRCASGCPVCEDDCDVTPDRLIRLVLLGDRQTALANELIWKCVSCFTCGARCPNNIRVGKISETLRAMAMEAGIEPMLPDVQDFHLSFLNDIKRWGRVNEIGLMGEYELHHILNHLKKHEPQLIVQELKDQFKLLREMIRLRRLHLKLQKTKGRDELRRLRQKDQGKQWK